MYPKLIKGCVDQDTQQGEKSELIDKCNMFLNPRLLIFDNSNCDQV